MAGMTSRPNLIPWVRWLPDSLWQPGARAVPLTPLYIDRHRGPRGSGGLSAHPFWELTAVAAGCERIEGACPIELPAQVVCLIPPGYPHNEWAATDVDTIWLGFRARRMPARLRGRPYALESKPLTDLLNQLWLFAESAQGRIGPELDAQTANIVHRFVRLWEAGASEPAASSLQRAIEFLAGHYAEVVRLESVARRFGYSEGHFFRAFKRRTGLTPNAYLSRVRMQHACRLLRESSLSVKEIAHRVGVPDEAYFSRWFHRLRGVAPTVWRRTPPTSPVDPVVSGSRPGAHRG